MSTNPDTKNKDDNKDDKKKAIWTVLIYMAGDNNLSEECVYALNEAKEGLGKTTPDKLAVLAQFDPSGVGTETKRYLLRSADESTLTEDAEVTGWKARETDTGQPLTLLEFIRWGMALHPARYYMVVVSGHGGSSIDEDFLARDENPPSSLNLLGLRYVFEQLEDDDRMIHILGMDTCLMNMAEACFELNQDSVKYLVASEGFSPNTGWPYKEILRALQYKIDTEPDKATPEWFGEQIVQEYYTFYEPYINGGISVDQSVLEVKKMDAVKKKMFSLCGALLDEIEAGELDYGKPKQNALVLAHWDAQSYNGELFVDLHDFCDRLIVRYGQVGYDKGEVIKLCQEVNTAIDDLVKKSCIAGAASQFSYGLSIYFPWAMVSSNYRNLAFPKESRWLDFLHQYHEKTRRPSRKLATEAFPGTPNAGYRASVPTNRGRTGRVESMRNPPTKEFLQRPASRVDTNGKLQPTIDVSQTRNQPSSNGDKTPVPVQTAQAEAVVGYSPEGAKKSNHRE